MNWFSVDTIPPVTMRLLLEVTLDGAGDGVLVEQEGIVTINVVQLEIGDVWVAICLRGWSWMTVTCGNRPLWYLEVSAGWLIS